MFDFDHEALGRTKTIGIPPTFCRVSTEVRTGAPELGQHTEEVLPESGHSWDDIQALRDRGLIQSITFIAFDKSNILISSAQLVTGSRSNVIIAPPNLILD